MSKLKSGFTLAEVLITLGIIGVVAAMTIPTIIANTNGQKYRSQLKKTISVLSQAARMSQSLYDFDYAGIDSVCGTNGATENPENTHTICAMYNGTLKGTTYYPTSSDLKMIKNGKLTPYTISSPFSLRHGLTTSTTNAYVLSDGTIVMLSKSLGSNDCSLSIGTSLPDIILSDGSMRFCYGFIDVNGVNLPNTEVSCSTGSNLLSDNSCVVKNDAKHLTDIYPIRIHDGIVEPATAAARYVLRTAK